MFQSEDIDAIESVLSALRESPSLTEVELRQGEKTLIVRRSAKPTAATQPAAKSAGRNGNGAKGTAGVVTAPAARPVERVPVTAQLVGIFRATRPSPVAEEDMVREKQVVGQIEAMRLMNDCTAPISGRVVAVAVQDGQPVQYGQILFEILPEPIGEVAS